jgi:hypothetical protein
MWPALDFPENSGSQPVSHDRLRARSLRLFSRENRFSASPAFENGFAMADALAAHCRPLKETRGPNCCCQWLAECEVDGRRFTARSRYSVVCELARMLVGAGIADRSLCVYFAGVAGHMTWNSFVAAARWTLTEGVATPLRRTPWKEFDAKL